MSFLGRLRRRRSRRGEDNAVSTDFALDASQSSQIEELLEAQGRCLDEANANLHTVQKENSELRDRLSCAISSSSSQSRLPLRNMTNHKSEIRQSKLLVEENRLLAEQAAILSSELRDANRALVEKDSNIASLGESLAASIQKSRRISSLQEALLIKTKEVEGSLANESRLNSIIMDLEANAKSSLKERDEVMKDAASHAQTADGLSQSLAKAQSSLASKQAEVENLSMELAASKRDAASALQEKEMSSEAALCLRRSLSISTARNEKLEREAEDNRTRLEDSKIAQHSLQVSHDHTQAEMQEIIKSHKACVLMSQLGALQEQLKEANEEVASLHSEVHSLKIRNDTQSKVIAKRDQELLHAVGQVDYLRTCAIECKPVHIVSPLDWI